MMTVSLKKYIFFLYSFGIRVHKDTFVIYKIKNKKQEREREII